MKLWTQVLFLAICSTSVARAQASTAYYAGGLNGEFETSQYYFTLNPNNLTIPDSTTELIFVAGTDGTVSSAGLVNPSPGSTIEFLQTADESLRKLTVSGAEFDINTGVETDNQGTVDYTLGGNSLTIGQDLRVEGNATLNLSGGPVAVQGNIYVGTANDLGSTGTLIIGSNTFTDDSAGFNEMSVGQGAQGTVMQSGGSAVTTGPVLFIGVEGTDTSGTEMTGTGTYTLTGASSLSTGSLAGTTPDSYQVILGYNEAAGESSAGTLNVTDSSFTANMGTDVEVGGGTGSADGGTGTINESVTTGSSTVTLAPGSTMELGFADDSTGIYNLSGGAFNITGGLTGSSLTLAQGTGSTGILTQSGGTLTADGNSIVIIGENGIGTYNLSGGTATFGTGFIVGDNSGSTGAVTQTGTGSGSSLIANGAVTIGGATGSGTTGSYSITQTSTSGAVTAAFNAGLDVAATGSFTQTGGTVTASILQVDGAYTQSGGANTISTVGGLTINGTYNMGGTLTTSGGTNGVGTLNFTGGTLAAGTGGALFDYFNSTISSTSTIDTTNNNVIIDGVLSGGGGLVLTGGKTIYFDLANTYTGGTTITGGATLDTNLALLPATGAITFSNGTLNLADFTTADGYFANPITGTGGNLLTAAGHTLELIGPVSITGTTNIGLNGTLQVFNGTFGTVTGGGVPLAETVDIGGASLVAGAPAVPTSGAVTFTAPATYLGPTLVNSGFSLAMDGLAGDLNNNGAISSSAGIGTVTIGGNFTQSSTGAFAVRANPFAHDEYDVNNATLAGNVNVVAQGNGTYTIVDAGAGTVTDMGLTASDISPLITTTLTTDAHDVFLTVVQGTTLPFAQTPNQRAVSQAIDPFVVNPTPDFVPVVAALDSLTLSQIPGALQELTPQSLQYMRNITLENTTFMTEHLDGHLADLRSGYSGLDASGLSLVSPGFGSNLGRSLMAYYAPAPNGVNYYHENPDDVVQPVQSVGNSDSKTISDSPDPLSSPASVPPAPTSRMSEFVSGDVILADLKQNNSSENAPSSKATYTAGNATAGVSFRMTNNLAAGVLFDYTHTDAKTDSQGSKTRVDSYSPGIYATFFKGGFYANGLFSYGYNQYSNSRNLSFGGLSSTATSSPTGNQYVTNADFGYDFQPDKHIIIGPTLGLQYTHLDIDSFSEGGAGPVDLNVGDESLDSLRSRLGAHFIYQTHIASVLLQPHVSAAWQHEFLDTSYGINSQFALPGSSSFNFQTAALGRDSALLSFGLTATLDNSLSAYVNYLAEVGDYDYFVQSVQGGIKAQF